MPLIWYDHGTFDVKSRFPTVTDRHPFPVKHRRYLQRRICVRQIRTDVTVVLRANKYGTPVTKLLIKRVRSAIRRGLRFRNFGLCVKETRQS